MKLNRIPVIRVANSFMFFFNSQKIFPTFFTVSVMFTEGPQLSVYLAAHLIWSGRSDLILAYYSILLVKISVETNGLSLTAYGTAYTNKDKLFLNRDLEVKCV
jgi:hypothetical protein